MVDVNSNAERGSIAEVLRNALLDWIHGAAKNPGVVFPLIMAIAISIVSFSTTSWGFSLFGFPIVTAFLVTAATQAGLFWASLEIGRFLNGRTAHNIIIWLIFSIAFTWSVWFSFTYLFTNVFSGKQEENAQLLTVRNTVAESVEGIRRDRITYGGDLAGITTGSDAFTGWANGIAQLSDLARQSGVQLSANRESAREQILDKLTKQKEALENLMAIAQDAAATPQLLRADIITAETKIAELTERLAANRPRAATLRREIAEFQRQMDDEETNGNPPGRGPKWRALDGQRLVRKNELDRLEPSITSDGEELAQARIELETTKARLATLEGSNTSPQEDPLVAATRQEVARLEAEFARLQVGSAGESLNVSARLESVINTLRVELTEVAYQATVGECQAVKSEIAELGTDLQSSIENVRCDSPEVDAAIVNVKDFRDKAEEFGQTCSARSEGFTGLTSAEASAAVDYGYKCLQLASLPATMSGGYRDEFARLLREENPDASPITKTFNGLSSFEPLAFVALFVAFCIDLFVLFLGFFSARGLPSKILDEMSVRGGESFDREVEASMDIAPRPHADAPARVWNAYRVLMLHTPIIRRSGKVDYEAEFDLDGMDDSNRKFLLQVLGAWIAEGKATYQGQAQNKHGRILLAKGGMKYFRAIAAEGDRGVSLRIPTGPAVYHQDHSLLEHQDFRDSDMPNFGNREESVSRTVSDAEIITDPHDLSEEDMKVGAKIAEY